MAAPFTVPIVQQPVPLDYFEVYALFHAVSQGNPLPKGWRAFINARTTTGEGLLQTAAGPGNNLEAVATLMAAPGLVECPPTLLRGGHFLGDHMDGLTPLATIPPIVVSAAHGNIEIVEYLHEAHGIPYDTMSVAGLTPLVAAMMNSEYDMVRWLRTRVPSVSFELPAATLMPANCAVAMAAYIGDPELLDPLALMAADLNRYYRLNDRCLGINAPHPAVTPIGIVLWRGRDQGWPDTDVAAMVAELLRGGADPNQPVVGIVRTERSTKFPPLQVALSCRYEECVRLLLVAGADPNTVLWSQSVRESPVDLAMRYALPVAAKNLVATGGRCLATESIETILKQRHMDDNETPAQTAVRMLYEMHCKLPKIEEILLRVKPDRPLFQRALENMAVRPAHVRFSDVSARFALNWCVWSQRAHWCMPRHVRLLAKTVIEASTITSARDGRPVLPLLPLELWWVILSFVM